MVFGLKGVLYIPIVFEDKLVLIIIILFYDINCLYHDLFALTLIMVLIDK